MYAVTIVAEKVAFVGPTSMMIRAIFASPVAAAILVRARDWPAEVSGFADLVA